MPKTFHIPNPSKKQIEVYNDFSGGLNTELADSATKDNQFRKLINFDMDAAGALVKRPGLYRIPFVKTIIDLKIKELISNNVLTYEDYRDLEIKDVQQFFDGLHWVFNYITSAGLFVLILDSNMNIPQDLEPEEYCLHYSLSNLKDNPTPEELENEIGDKIKISQYGSIYVMYATQYSNSTGIINTNKKQVRLFSWNPIKDDTQTIDGKPARPGWIEASDNNNEVDDLIYYGKTEIKTINSNKLDLSDIPNQTFNITAGKYIPSFLNDDSIKQYSVEYKTNNVDLSWLEITTNGVKEQFNIVDGNGIQIKPTNIETCTFENNNIKFYFNKAVNMVDEKEHNDTIFNRTFYKRSFLKRHHLYFNLEKKKFDYGITDNFYCSYRTEDGYISNATYDGVMFYSGGSTEINYYAFGDKWNGAKLSKYDLTVHTSNTNNIIFTTNGALSLFDVEKKCKTYFDNNWDYSSDKNLKNSLSIKYISGSHRPNTCNFSFSALCFFIPNSIPCAQITVNNYYGFIINNYIDNDINDINNFNINNFEFKKPSLDILAPGPGNADDYYELQWKTYEHAYVLKDNVYDINKSINSEYKNIINKNNTQALATGTYFVDNKNIIPIQHTKNTFLFEKLTTSNLSKWLNINKVENDFLKRVPILGSTLFLVDKLDELKEQYLKDNIVSLDFNINYEYNGEKLFIKSNLKEYEVNDFLNALLWDDITSPKLFLEVLKFNNRVEVINLIWKDSFDREHILCEINQDILNGISVNDILNTLYFNFTYKQLIGGRNDVVLTFKQQKYVKPNLNDLQYLWYNLVLFSRFGSNRWPNIYDDKIHKNISWDLVEYPNIDDTQQTNYIQLFGLVPVNNVILAPGKQKFQLFYNLRNDIDTNNLRIALTAMTIKDYNQMINSPDYSTTGYKNDNSGNETGNRTTGPNWVNFDSFFLADETGLDDDKVWNEEKKEWEPKPKKAIFEVDVPTTTQPYMILIQVAQTRFDDTNPNKIERINLATVVETRIEMQPNSSYVEKLNPKSLFDEFTTTTNLSTYSTNLVMYGSTNKIYFSDISVPSYFPLSRIIEFQTPEAIKSCTIFQNKLIVSTDNSRWYIGGSSFDSERDPFYIKNVSTDSGILASKSDIPMGNYLYFLDNTGIKILKNLYGTADKEFAYETIDSIISSQVPRDSDACGCAYNNKYYICFPNYKYMLVYNQIYKAWVSYEGNYFNFTKMFVNDGILYGIDKDTFAIYRFDNNTFVDDWNEIEDGYEEITNIDGIKQKVQKGKAITCYMETKNLDQNYIPHRKKYDWALLEANVNGIDGTDIKGFTKQLIPYIKVDDNLINYTIDFYSLNLEGNTTWIYKENSEPYGIIIRDDSLVNLTSIVGFNRLGKNDNGTFYNVPIRRKGNSIAFGFVYDAPCGLTIKSLSIRYNLLDIRKNRGGQS